MWFQVWYQDAERIQFMDDRVNPERLVDTHVCLGWIEADGPDRVFAWLNEPNEAPHAKSRMLQRDALARARIIQHVSMSVGDVLINDRGERLVCAKAGWRSYTITRTSTQPTLLHPNDTHARKLDNVTHACGQLERTVRLIRDNETLEDDAMITAQYGIAREALERALRYLARRKKHLERGDR